MSAAPLPPLLGARLQALAESLAGRADALGLLAPGSVGQETARADAWSDLDFSVQVQGEMPAAVAARIRALAAD